MKYILALFSLALAAATPVPEGGPDPSQVYVESISYGGTGCPQGSVAKSLSDDRTTFTLIFDKYIASVGPNLAVTESRKVCQLNVNLRIPGGWSYSIGHVDYRGYVQLPAGQTATQQSTYYFAGEVAQAKTATHFSGPISQDYTKRDTVPLNAVVWCKCNAVVPLNVKTEVRIDNSKNKHSQGMITVDSIDGKIKHVLGLQWKRC